MNSTPLLKRPAVSARTTLSRTSIHRLVKAGLFPAPVKLSARSVAWRLVDIEAWEAARQPTIEAATEQQPEPPAPARPIRRAPKAGA